MWQVWAHGSPKLTNIIIASQKDFPENVTPPLKEKPKIEVAKNVSGNRRAWTEAERDSRTIKSVAKA